MAERGGFEPPIDLRLCLISSQVHSTGLCHLSTLSIVSGGRRPGDAAHAFNLLVNAAISHKDTGKRQVSLPADSLEIAYFAIRSRCRNPPVARKIVMNTDRL